MLNGNRVPTVRLGDYLAYGTATIVEGNVLSEGNVPDFQLEQNFPNPFNPTTTIAYSVPAIVGSPTISVQVKVFDVLGREIEVLLSKDVSPGRHSIRFDGSNLPSGVYYYGLYAGSFAGIMKMVLVK